MKTIRNLAIMALVTLGAASQGFASQTGTTATNKEGIQTIVQQAPPAAVVFTLNAIAPAALDPVGTNLNAPPVDTPLSFAAGNVNGAVAYGSNSEVNADTPVAAVFGSPQNTVTALKMSTMVSANTGPTQNATNTTAAGATNTGPNAGSAQNADIFAGTGQDSPQSH
jgi:hypothetical protein